MLTNYIDFEITFQQRNGDVFPFLAESTKGQANGILADLGTDPSFQQMLNSLREGTTDEDLLISLGKTLYNALFQGQVRDRFVATQGGLDENHGIRLKIRTTPGDTAVGSLPWEFLYEPNQDNPFVLLNISVVRYPQAPVRVPNLEAKLPLRLLLTGAQPRDMSATYAERELDAVLAAFKERGLADAGQIEVVEERHLTRAKFQRLLRQGFHVWHFAGHGGFSRDGKSGVLFFEDMAGAKDAVSARELGILMASSGVRLILLDACESAALALEPFRSVAPALIANGVPAVIAMQFAVPEEATTAFAGEFYFALGEGLPVDACVTEGRKAVMAVSGLRNPDWGIPTVFTRAPDGVLFRLPEKPQVQVEQAKPQAGVVNDFSGSKIEGPVTINTGGVNVSGNTFNSGSPSATADDLEMEREALQDQLTVKKRRLHRLQLQQATFGISADPSIIIQIEDLEKEINQAEQQLKNLL